ncbi:hypothetical protein F4802DRAFT_587279 [Xylaria palmicola]|nr:hypothetical protein F4802DRAFT_587279 [Xylaria palmicola]
MSSDDNVGAQRALPRDIPSSNTPLRRTVPPTTQHLPPLRSLTTRRPSAMSASNNPGPSSAQSRVADRWPGDYHSQHEADLANMSSLGILDPMLDFIWADGDPLPDEGEDEDDDEEEDGAVQSIAQHRTYAEGHLPVANITSWPPYSPLYSGVEDGHSQLRALLDYTHDTSAALPELFSSRTTQRHEPPEDNRRVKRRKLDSDRLSSNFRGFQYGKYGQVQPGDLKMELVSCDGGIYSDDTTKYVAENILKNDETVYCTEGPRCNIVLRHQGATVFTLKELVIKAPRSNFTSPVQEGMVFVSMSSDHLLNRTAQYQIQYSPVRSSSRRNERGLPLGSIISIRHNDDGSTMTRAQVRARRLYEMGLDDEDDDVGIAQIPSEFNVSPPPFQVTTECSDDEEDGPNGRLSGRTPNRIGSLPFESDSSDDEGPDDFAISRTDYRSRRRRNRSSTGLAEAAEAAQIATQEAVRAVGGELMTPTARFYIESHKSKCTLRFDPPISGRFILLKMWNPRRRAHSNIDIQAVVAKGFAGPRFFPSVESR